TVSNDVYLSGIVEADPAVTSKANLTGDVIGVHVKLGSVVKEGQKIATIKGFNSAGQTITSVVKARSAGTISSLSIVKNQLVNAGETIAKIAPPGFHVTATVQPIERYRLTGAPTEAMVTINGGPAP